jgi:hypothetical protein
MYTSAIKKAAAASAARRATKNNFTQLFDQRLKRPTPTTTSVTNSTNTSGETKTIQESSSSSNLHTHMPDMIFTENTLVIPTSQPNINLELKNMFCVNESTLDRGDAVRIYALLKLPEELFPDGYRNAYNEIERWFPIYRSSGTNSHHKGSWHPYYCAVAHSQPPNENGMHQYLNGFLKFTLNTSSMFQQNPILDYKDKLWMEKLDLNKLHLNGWMIKCKMRNILSTQSDDLDDSIKLKNLNDKEKTILKERFIKMHQTLASLNALEGKLDYENPSNIGGVQLNGKNLGPAPSTYLCNNFFNLVNDTMKNTKILKFEETKEKTIVEKVDSKEKFTINNIINPPNFMQLVNNAIGKHNIFGMNVNRQSLDPEIENIINMINKYERLFHQYLKKINIKNRNKRNNTIKTVLEVLVDRANLHTINELFEKLTDDPKFITTLRSSKDDNINQIESIEMKNNDKKKEKPKFNLRAYKNEDGTISITNQNWGFGGRKRKLRRKKPFRKRFTKKKRKRKTNFFKKVYKKQRKTKRKKKLNKKSRRKTRKRK